MQTPPASRLQVVHRTMGEAVSWLPSDLRAEFLALIPEVQAWERVARRSEAAACIVFAPATDDACLWRVGYPHRLREVPGNLLGLRAAWLAIRGELPSCADLAGGATHNAASIISRAVRKQATAWARRDAGCPELAAAFLRISVQGGRLHYAEPEGVPRIVPGHFQVNGGSPAQ